MEATAPQRGRGAAAAGARETAHKGSTAQNDHRPAPEKPGPDQEELCQDGGQGDGGEGIPTAQGRGVPSF